MVRPQPIRRSYAAAWATALMILSVILVLNYPDERQVLAPSSITVYVEPMATWFAALACFSWIACLVTAWTSLRARNPYGFLSLTALVLSPGILFVGYIAIHLMDSTDVAKVFDEQGNEYHMFAYALMQGNSLDIAKVTSRTATETKFQFLVSTSYEGEHLRLVRPEGGPASPQLFLTSNGILVGVPDGNRSFAAYDLRNEIKYDVDGPNGGVNAAGEISKAHKIRELSSFILIGTSDKPSESDFQNLLLPDGFSAPDMDVLKRDLDHPNPRVREMVARYLKHFGK